MKLAQRFAFYGVGFLIGLVILFFFLGGKKTSCDYGFDARTLKNIRSKKLVFSPEAKGQRSHFKIDTTIINSVLKNGDVDFSETDRSLDSCKVYLVSKDGRNTNYLFRIKNCTKTATVLSIEEQK